MRLSRGMTRKIRRDAINNMKKKRMDRKANLFLHKDELPAKSRLRSAQIDVEISRRTALVFADLAPEFNWGHPCKHMLYDAKTGELYEEINDEFPPKEFFKDTRDFKPIRKPIKPKVFIKERRRAKMPKLYPFKQRFKLVIPKLLLKFLGTRYAILFAGMSHNRHTNDLEFLYRTLIDVYNYHPNNIYVLNYDGTINYQDPPDEGIGNWPGDNTAYQMPVNDQGSKAALEAVFDDLKNKIGKTDTLFIHTNNHGGHPADIDESTLCCFPNWDSYPASDFAAKLAELPAFATLIVMMEQCHSGGFSNPVLTNSPATYTHFAAACAEDKSSKGGLNFDPYAEDWIAAIAGEYPDGSGLEQEVDTSDDGRISVSEAHIYATAVKHPFDTPESDDDPDDCGNNLFL